MTISLHETTDATVWAAEFCKRWPCALCQIPGREGVSGGRDFEGIMIGWFANAIMAGVDSEARKNVDPAAVRAEVLREAAAVIDRNDSAPCIPNEAWSDDQQNYYVSGQLDAATSWQRAILALIDKEQDK